MKVLITGFDPFGGETINPAFSAVNMIKDTICGAEIIKIEIPTVFKLASKAIENAINEHKPQIVILVGQAGGRSEIAVERIGINLDDARIPDNKGNQPIDELIEPNGKNAYFSNLPVKAIVESLKDNAIPAVVSYSAGTFVCNHVLYSLMHLIELESLDIRGGFVHVPFLPEQVVNKGNVSSMSLETIREAIEVIISAAIKHSTDIKAVGGSIY